MTNLKAARTDRNITQAALALAARVPQATISRLERDENRTNPSWRVATRLAAVLAVDPRELFVDTPDTGAAA